MWSVAHGYFAYVNKTLFAYPEHLVHKGVTPANPLGERPPPGYTQAKIMIQGGGAGN